MKNRKPKITVGIPVHNEVDNIGYLLQSIIRQKMTNFKLEKILVVCDGTTDGTDKKVLEIAKNNPIIKLFNDGKRKGKMKRLMQMYGMNRSDFIFIFDGDIVLSNADVINNMIRRFDDEDVVVVGGNNQPVKAENFTQKLTNQWSHIWYLARTEYNNCENVHNIRGCVMGLRKDFAKSIIFPKEVVSDAQYIYFLALSRKLRFRYAKDAIILYRKPNSLGDYMFQTRRSSPEKGKLVSIFGKQVIDKYKIPFKYKIGALLKMSIQDPIFTILAGGFYVFSHIFPYKKVRTKKEVLWKSAKSTKKAITFNSF